MSGGQHHDRGFTLIETVMVVAMLVLIVAAPQLPSPPSFDSSTPLTEATVDDARTLLGMTTYLPEDVDSTPASGFDLPPTRTASDNQSTGCAGERNRRFQPLAPLVERERRFHDLIHRQLPTDPRIHRIVGRAVLLRQRWHRVHCQHDESSAGIEWAGSGRGPGALRAHRLRRHQRRDHHQERPDPVARGTVEQPGRNPSANAAGCVSPFLPATCRQRLEMSPPPLRSTLRSPSRSTCRTPTSGTPW